MQKYEDTDRDSGVSHYEIGETSIAVWFKGGAKPYRFSYGRAGMLHVEQMKRLAVAGDGRVLPRFYGHFKEAS
jgi:NADH:ubiquinone oxidoreductase subunit D